MSDTHTDRPVVVDTGSKSESGPIAAVIITVLFLIFGWWAVNTFVASDSGVDVPDEIGITITEDGNG